MNGVLCSSLTCDKPALFQCPTCIKLGIVKDFQYCSKDCFQHSWNVHKLQHKQARTVDNFRENFFSYSGPLRPFAKSLQKVAPDFIQKPDYATNDEGISISEKHSKATGVIKELNPEEIIKMKKSCKLGREVLDVAARAIKIGITTDEIDEIVHQACINRNCYPSPLNYYKFPKSCCTSVNEVICHGTPDKRPLENGDIVNVDITVYHDGYHGDLNETFFVGEVDEASKKLVQTTHDCLMKAIDIVKPGVKYRDIGNVIQKIANSQGFSVVKSFCGHGIHQVFHTLPNVPHYAKNKAIGVMKPGHVFTIEPMINQGTWHDIIWPDDWTATTQDGKRSAQFEQTLLVTENGCEILTARNDPKYGTQPHFKDNLN